MNTLFLSLFVPALKKETNLPAWWVITYWVFADILGGATFYILYNIIK